MVYIPVSQRTKTSGAGYVPVAERRKEEQEYIPVAQRTQPQGLVKSIVKATPGAIRSAASSFLESERQRKATQTVGQDFVTTFVERPAKILKGLTVDLPRMIAGGLSGLGKSVIEAAYSPIVGKEKTRRALSKDAELEKKLFKFETESWQQIKDNIDEFASKSPEATPWEKKYLGVTLATAGFMADSFTGGGKSKLGSKAIKELVEATTDDLARATLLKYGVPQELAERSAPGIARATDAQSVENVLRGEAALLLKNAGDTANLSKDLPPLPKLTEAPARPVNTETENLSKSVSEATYDSKLVHKSKVVNSDVPRKGLSEATYEANRASLEKQKGRIAKTAESLNDVRKSIGEGADKLLGTISTRLKNIDPSLKTAIRTFEYKLAQSMQKDRRAVEPFLKGAKDISITDYADLDLALKNGDFAKTSQIIKKYGLEEEFAKVRTVLDDLYKRAEEVGYDIGYEKNYFPRTIKDSAGMLEYLQKGDDWSIIDEAIKAKELDLGRYLTIDEKANVVNTLVRGYPTGKITLSETGAMKARRIDVVDAELNQFYNDSVESLIKYIDSTNDAIEARRFFGKGNKTDKFANVDDSIGSYILDLMAKGKVKPSQEKELRDILQARFAQVGTSGVVRVYKNLSYIDTMGSPISAITQLGDLAFAIYKGGTINTVKSFGRALVGKSKITRADIGIEKIAQEFEDASRSARAVDRVFRLVGLHKLDALGKETVINASLAKYRRLAEEPSADFLRKLDLVFGESVDKAKVLDDLKAGRTTEDVKLLAFNELLDVQPVALSEMPEQYLKGGNGRIFYMLKTYTIKLFDVYRNEVFQTMKTDKVKGMKNLLYLIGALVTMNATADEIKDVILNRETSLKDRTVDNILKLAGFSKFTLYKARQEGIGSAVAKTILPPFKFIDSLYKDIARQNEVAELETIQSIPVGGKLYYWWFGKGASKTEEKRGSSGFGGASLPDLPELPKLPTLPKLPKF